MEPTVTGLNMDVRLRIEAALLLLYPLACVEGPLRDDTVAAVLKLEEMRDLVRSLADSKGAP